LPVSATLGALYCPTPALTGQNYYQFFYRYARINPAKVPLGGKLLPILLSLVPPLASATLLREAETRLSVPSLLLLVQPPPSGRTLLLGPSRRKPSQWPPGKL
jgi:hypothetical protein